MANTRPLTFKTPLKDELAITSLQGHESLGRLFQYDLELFSLNEEINIDDILGQAVTVHFDAGSDEERYFNGIVSAFSQTGQVEDGGATYQATLRPWLWFLTRAADCRVFLQMSVPDIIKQVIKDQGFSDIRDELTEKHEAWDFCVQYRETDFNFISRLMEEEGIYYYFTHEKDKHILVLADSGSAHEAIRNDAVMYYAVAGSNLRSEQCVSSWFVRREVQPGAYALNDYDFRRPKAALRVREQIQKKHAGSEYEIYDYPGEYADRFEGSKGEYADLRIQELHVQQDRAEGITDLRIMSTGGLFKLDNHPRKDQNKEYLVTDTVYEISLYGDSGGGNEMVYQCQFTAIDSQTPFRPGRVTRKPVVQGPQTAVVVDDAADEYGRVKVRFFWDRDEDDSCWVRVSQNSAGMGWGSMFVPHVGHEVIVSFLEGDPDRPIITGRVYNAENMPPDLWTGGIDNSVITDHVENKINLDGAGTPIIHITQPSGNEILMNDDEGIQVRDHYGNEIVMDAQQGTIKIRSPSHESVFILGQSLYFSTDSDAKTLVKGNETRLISGKLETKILDFTSETFVGMKHSQSLAATYDTFIGLKTATSMAVDISGNKDIKVFKDKKVEHTLDEYMKVAAKQYVKFNVDGESSELHLTKTAALTASGASSIEIKKDAEIIISGKNKVNVNGPDQITLSAKKGEVKMKAGSKGIKLNTGGNVTVSGSKINIG
ncbi:MAG TPA: type VI secretion system tip protein VgrG [Gammaproteobacteria bacterium]|nr:type VI secretion system tip protein VgrG [Gammaproteobacteria bacterium]